MKNPDIALILAAAGIGSRFGSNKPKQFFELENLPIYMWSVISFGINEQISRIVIVTGAENIEAIDSRLSNKLSELDLKDIYSKVSYVSGGKSRQESVYKGLLSLKDSAPEYVLVHDAARPFISQTSIKKVIDTTTRYGAAILATEVTDTIKKAEGSNILKTLDRTQLFSAQTPQGAKFEWLLKGHVRALSDNFEVTDDASILEFENHPVRVVEGDRTNLKITVADDLIIANAIAKKFFGQINDLIKAKNNLRS